MAQRKKPHPDIQDYRHEAKRKNNPAAGIADRGTINEPPKVEYAYNPHRPPRLRFDENGDADRLTELLQKAKNQVLSEEEVARLTEALQQHEPWLEWSGKQETQSFAVDPVALHIHERVSAKAIMNIAARENVQRNLFADPQLAYNEAVQFYQHDVEWANRLILGDSLTVMSSLAHREDLGGKVQTIYFDPPYGIKFASNFQPTVFQRNVTDKPADLTREPEQIQAYRDTWHLGVHSYLAYLRDRLMVARELLADSGSIFVQIGDENVHRVRCVLDEVFGAENLVAQICFKTTSGRQAKKIDRLGNYILWFAKNAESVKYHNLFVCKATSGEPKITRGDLQSQGASPTGSYSVEFEGKSYVPRPNRHWATTKEGMCRLIRADRVLSGDKSIAYKRLSTDFPVASVPDLWTDVSGGASGKVYVVQTNEKIIARCLLMTTDPGDLVLDPTCGSGTTAYVAEQWGRRWITIDTSRVAIALARQRLLTSSFDYYELKQPSKGIAGGFINKVVPHITLKSIAQNDALDPIFATHEPILAAKLAKLNRSLAAVGGGGRTSHRTAGKIGGEREARREKIHHRGRPAAMDSPRNCMARVGGTL